MQLNIFTSGSCQMKPQFSEVVSGKAPLEQLWSKCIAPGHLNSSQWGNFPPLYFPNRAPTIKKLHNQTQVLIHWYILEKHKNIGDKSTSPFSPLVSERCCLLFGWRARHAWSPPPSLPRCLGIYSCSRSVARCTWAACRTRSLSPQPTSSLLSCVDASCHWPAGSLTERRDNKTGQCIFLDLNSCYTYW